MTHRIAELAAPEVASRLAGGAVALLPMGRFPPGRTHMLRVLSGTQQGLFGQLALDRAFVEAFAEAIEGLQRQAGDDRSGVP